MERYYLITVRSYDGFTNTFIEKGTSTYSALLNKVESSEGKNGYIYSKNSCIIFAEEATQEDYQLYCKNT